MPDFMIYDVKTRIIYIRPTILSFHYGLHYVKVILSDSLLTTEYTFFVTVSNKAPYFESEIKDIKLPLNTEFEYSLPVITEKEKLPYRIVVTLADGSKLPNNIIFNENNATIKIL
jgi:hypothetical protein